MRPVVARVASAPGATPDASVGCIRCRDGLDQYLAHHVDASSAAMSGASFRCGEAGIGEVGGKPPGTFFFVHGMM
jgi:hypothetical protein